jgi:hypothetical protein
VGLKSGDGHILRSYSPIRAIVGPYGLLGIRTRGLGQKGWNRFEIGGIGIETSFCSEEAAS